MSSSSDELTINLADRIELRRFVGREHLLWLWFESEVFEATLATKTHGSFGMWLESRLVLSDGREVTSIKGTAPGNHREAKESLRRGKLPERAGLHLSWADHEVTFTLKAETFGIAGLALPTVLDKKNGDEGDAAQESFYERMHLARDVEVILEALYSDFLAIRLSDAWSDAVLPAIQAWVSGKPVDSDAYRATRDAALRGEPVPSSVVMRTRSVPATSRARAR
jgi:hypothetical protein